VLEKFYKITFQLTEHQRPVCVCVCVCVCLSVWSDIKMILFLSMSSSAYHALALVAYLFTVLCQCQTGLHNDLRPSDW